MPAGSVGTLPSIYYINNAHTCRGPMLRYISPTVHAALKCQVVAFRIPLKFELFARIFLTRARSLLNQTIRIRAHFCVCMCVRLTRCCAHARPPTARHMFHVINAHMAGVCIYVYSICIYVYMYVVSSRIIRSLCETVGTKRALILVCEINVRKKWMFANLWMYRILKRRKTLLNCIQYIIIYILFWYHSHYVFSHAPYGWINSTTHVPLIDLTTAINLLRCHIIFTFNNNNNHKLANWCPHWNWDRTGEDANTSVTHKWPNIFEYSDTACSDEWILGINHPVVTLQDRHIPSFFFQFTSITVYNIIMMMVHNNYDSDQ